MALANRYTGKDLVIMIGSGDGQTPIYGDYKTMSVSQAMNSAEGTAGGDTHEYPVPTYPGGSIDLEVLAVTSEDDYYEDIQLQIAPGATGPLIWYPESGSVGTPKFTATGFVEKSSVDHKFDDLVSLKLTFRCTAAIVETTVLGG